MEWVNRSSLGLKQLVPSVSVLDFGKLSSGGTTSNCIKACEDSNGGVNATSVHCSGISNSGKTSDENGHICVKGRKTQQSTGKSATHVKPMKVLKNEKFKKSPLTHFILNELPNVHRADGSREDDDEVNSSLLSWNIKQNQI